MAAKYYRLAEQHGNKLLGNSWYVSTLFLISRVILHLPLEKYSTAAVLSAASTPGWWFAMLCRYRVSDVMRVMGSIGSRTLPPRSALHILVQSPPTVQHLLHPPTSAIYDLVLAFSLRV